MTDADRESRPEPERATPATTDDADAVNPGDDPTNHTGQTEADQAVVNQERMVETGEENSA